MLETSSTPVEIIFPQGRTSKRSASHVIGYYRGEYNLYKQSQLRAVSIIPSSCTAKDNLIR